jgi:hypothetical protein
MKKNLKYLAFCFIFLASTAFFCACEKDEKSSSSSHSGDGYVKKAATEQVINESVEQVINESNK